MNLFNSTWLKSGLYSIGSRASLLLFGFGSFYFLVRALTKAEFGAWSLFLTVTTILEMSRNGLIQNALIKLLHSHKKEEATQVISASWIINAIYSVGMYFILVALAGVASTIFGVPDLRLMFIYFGITLIILVPLSQFNYIQQAHMSFGGIFWAAFVRQGLFFLIILVCFFFKIRFSLIELVMWQAVCTLVGLLVAFISARKYLSFQFNWNKAIAAKVFHFGKYVMGTNIFSLFFKSTDQFSVGYLLNPVSVALYSAAIRMSNMIEYPATAVAEVMYPHSTSKINEKGEYVVKALYEKSVGFTLALTFPIVLVTFIFSDLIIYLIAGDGYADSSGILRITILFGILTPFNRQFGMAMDSSNRPQLNFYLLVFAFSINLVTNFIGITLWGVIGAAYATLFSYFIISVIGHYVLVKLFAVELREVLRYMWSSYSQVFNFVKNALLVK